MAKTIFGNIFFRLKNFSTASVSSISLWFKFLPYFANFSNPPIGSALKVIYFLKHPVPRPTTWSTRYTVSKERLVNMEKNCKILSFVFWQFTVCFFCISKKKRLDKNIKDSGNTVSVFFSLSFLSISLPLSIYLSIYLSTYLTFACETIKV